VSFKTLKKVDVDSNMVMQQRLQEDAATHRALASA
jgi:hypothetical protein